METAKAFITQNTERLPKAMIPTGVQPYEAGDICALAFDNPDAEAAFIAKTIKNLHGVAFTEDGRDRGLAYSDVAILLRSVKANGEPIIIGRKGRLGKLAGGHGPGSGLTSFAAVV